MRNCSLLTVVKLLQPAEAVLPHLDLLGLLYLVGKAAALHRAVMGLETLPPIRPCLIVKVERA